MDALFHHFCLLSADNQPVLAEVAERRAQQYPSVHLWFIEEKVPWRSTLVDPSVDTTAVEQSSSLRNRISQHIRQAAITKNKSFVTALNGPPTTSGSITACLYQM